jgi:hypothetical protein
MLNTHHLEFIAQAKTPLVLDEQPGSSLRGAFLNGLWERFCANKQALSCPECPAFTICPVAQLVSPLRAEGQSGGQQMPRPYVLRPPVGNQSFNQGDTLSFGLALFGTASSLFPFVVMAAKTIEQTGWGRSIAANHKQRGRIQIAQINAVNPLNQERQILYSQQQGQVSTPGLIIDHQAIREYAAQLPSDQLTLHFRTPLRLIDNQQLVRRFQVRPFVQRLVERVNQLIQAYGTGETLPALDVKQLTEQIIISQDSTQWLDITSNSRRQGRGTPIGGLVGKITLNGPLGPLRELLAWGAVIHVGKNTVKGDGWYSIS